MSPTNTSKALSALFTPLVHHYKNCRHSRWTHIRKCNSCNKIQPSFRINSLTDLQYFPPAVPADSKLSSILNKLSHAYILNGDFIFHKSMRGSSRYNRNGKVLVNHQNFVIINTSTQTYFNFSNQPWSNLDLILVSALLSSKLFIHTHTDLAESNHALII